MRIREKVWIFLAAAITVVLSCSIVFAEDQEISLEPQNGIPLVIVYVNETQSDIDAVQTADPGNVYGNISAMNNSNRHAVRAIGDVEIKVPAGYQSEYGSIDVPQGRISLKFIRGRGNSTWVMPKKPYKIKLNKGQDFFGMGKSKDWALMANYMDKSLVRNRITSWIGENSKLEYTTRMIPVDVVMIGFQKDENGTEQETSRDYLGSYCLSETVEIGENRVAIESLDENATDPDVIQGGYLLAMYSEMQDKDKVPAASHFTTPSGMQITNDDPEFTDDMTEGRSAQRDYIRDYINELDRLIMEPEEITPEIHEQIAAKMDLESLADYWWIQECSYNTDAFETGSTYMYKPRNDRLIWGPLWDFDLAWQKGMDDEQGFSTGFNNTKLEWVDRLREKDPLFVQILKDRWTDEEDGIRKALSQLTKKSEDGILNQYMEEIRDSYAADQKRWPDDIFQAPDIPLNDRIEQLRFWIDKRAGWIDDNLEEKIDKVYYTATFKAETGEVLATVSVREGQSVDEEPDAPEKPGYVFVGWKDETTGTDLDEYEVRGDVTFIPEYMDESEIIQPTQVFFRLNEDWAAYTEPEAGDDPPYYYIDDPIIIPEDAFKNQIKWTSSDESILTFESPGVPILKGTGEVDITVTLINGLSATLHLHVYDPDVTQRVDPESMEFEPEYRIGVGETRQILPVFLPQGTPLKPLTCAYEADDESIVTINDSEGGVITGMKPGSTTIRVTASDVIFDTMSLQSSFRITVTDDSGQPQKPESISKAKVALSKTLFTYNGKVQKPKIRSINGKALKAGKDYSIKWSNPSSKSVGKYTLLITGKGNYTGTAKASYKINPKGTVLRKLKKGRRAVKVKWKKQTAKMSSSRITGYQIQLATNKKFTKNKKTVSVKGYKKVSKRVTGLKGGRKYYVRIRTYKTIKGRRLYSPWSKVRTVKTR